MEYSSLNMEQLQALLTHFPQLRELTLEYMDQFDSLSFLEPVRSTLNSLSLNSCVGFEITAESLLVLRSFGLTRLQLSRGFGRALDVALVQLLTPPSTLLPTLEEFDYTPPSNTHLPR